MVNEVFLPGEGLATVGAGVRRVAGVLSDVVVEVFLAREGSRAVRTLVWRFSRVLSAQQSTFRFLIINNMPIYTTAVATARGRERIEQHSPVQPKSECTMLCYIL